MFFRKTYSYWRLWVNEFQEAKKLLASEHSIVVTHASFKPGDYGFKNHGEEVAVGESPLKAFLKTAYAAPLGSKPVILIQPMRRWEF